MPSMAGLLDHVANATRPDPSLRAPSKPQKTQISDAERQKEEEELQMALAMSIRESKGAAPATVNGNAKTGV